MKKLFAALVVAFALTAHAQLIVDFSGGQDLNVGPGSAGFEFTVATSQTIRSLGVYDWDQTTPGLYSSHTVGLWDSASRTLLASAVVPAQGATALGSFWYMPIAPLTLQAGHSYVLAASFADSDFDFARGNIASVTTAPGITMGDALLSSGTGFEFPDLAVPGANIGFLGPNATFAAIPETRFYMLAASIGLLGLVAMSRRLRNEQ